MPDPASPGQAGRHHLTLQLDMVTLQERAWAMMVDHRQIPGLTVERFTALAPGLQTQLTGFQKAAAAGFRRAEAAIKARSCWAVRWQPRLRAGPSLCGGGARR